MPGIAKLVKQITPEAEQISTTEHCWPEEMQMADVLWPAARRRGTKLSFGWGLLIALAVSLLLWWGIFAFIF